MKSRPRRHSRSLVPFLRLGWQLPALLLGTASLAEDLAGTPPRSNPTELAPMIVTATRRDEMSLDLPYAVEQFDGDRLRAESMPSSVPEALLETPGVLVQQTARGQGSPYLRGFTGFRTLALVDGIRLNNSTFRDGPNQYWSTVDVLAVEELEVVRGPGSVMYGSDAIGGVVNAVLRNPARASGYATEWNGLTAYRYGSAERAHLGRVEGGGVQKGAWGFHVGASLKDYGDLDGGRQVGRQLGTGFSQWDFDAKVRYDLGERTRLTFAHQTTEQDNVQRSHRTPNGLTWKGLVHGTDLQHFFDQARHLTYARLQHETEREDQFTATVSWHVQDEDQFVQPANRTWQKSRTDVDTLGLTLQGVSPSKWGTWTYGTDYYRDFVQSERKNYDAAGAFTSQAVQGPVGDDASYDDVGAYVQDQIPLGERLEVTVGGRFNWDHAQADRVRNPITGGVMAVENDWTQAVGSGRLRWYPTPDKDWSLYGGASQGFRAPNLSDLSRLDLARSGEVETAAPNLDPEKYVTVEGGTKFQRRSWEAEAAYYHTFIRDLIVRTPTGAIVGGSREVTKLNASSGWVHGVELSGRVFLGEGFSIFAQGAWQEGEADTFPTSTAASVRAPLSRMHPSMGLIGVRWETEKKDYFAEFFGMASDRQDRLSPEDARDTQRIPPGGTPGWATLNLRTGYTWKEKLRGVIGLENLTDEDYRIHGSGFNQPGRNFKLSVEYRF